MYCIVYVLYSICTVLYMYCIVYVLYSICMHSCYNFRPFRELQDISLMFCKNQYYFDECNLADKKIDKQIDRQTNTGCLTKHDSRKTT